MPRWEHDGEAEKGANPKLKEARETAVSFLKYKTGAKWGHPNFIAVLQELESYVPGRWLSVSDHEKEQSHDSAADLFNVLHSARKDQPMARALWPVVNVMLVDWDGNIAHRAGVGKVVMHAWQEEAAPPKEVLLG